MFCKVADIPILYAWNLELNAQLSEGVPVPEGLFIETPKNCQLLRDGYR